MMRGWGRRTGSGYLLRALLVTISTLSAPLGAFGATLPAPAPTPRQAAPHATPHATPHASATPPAGPPRPRGAATPRAGVPGPASHKLGARPAAPTRGATPSSHGSPLPGTRWFFAAQRLTIAGLGPRPTVRQTLAILNPNAVAVPVSLAIYPRGQTRPRLTHDIIPPGTVRVETIGGGVRGGWRPRSSSTRRSWSARNASCSVPCPTGARSTPTLRRGT